MSFMINPFAFGAGVNPMDFLNVLLGFEGTDGSTTITDEAIAGDAPHTFACSGNAQIDTAQFKFGSASLLLDGSGDYVSMTSSTSNLDLTGAADFTFEGWFRFAAGANMSGIHTFLSKYNSTSNRRCWILYFNGPTNTVRFAISTDGIATTNVIDAAWTPSVSTWYHVAACRAAGTLRVFIDGTSAGSAASTHNPHDTVLAPFRVGAIESGGTTNYFNGHVDEVRLHNGYAAYTGNFTPPAAAFPRP